MDIHCHTVLRKIIYFQLLQGKNFDLYFKMVAPYELKLQGTILIDTAISLSPSNALWGGHTNIGRPSLRSCKRSHVYSSGQDFFMKLIYYAF